MQKEDETFEKICVIFVILGFIALICGAYVFVFGIPNTSNLQPDFSSCDDDTICMILRNGTTGEPLEGEYYIEHTFYDKRDNNTLEVKRNVNFINGFGKLDIIRIK